MINFTRSLKASARQVETLDLQAFVGLLRQHWASPNVQIYEWLAGDPLVRVYFDVDGKTTDTTAPALMARCRAALAAFFHDQPAFDLDADVIFATSHGGPKLSIRAYAPAFAMHVADIKKRIRALRLGARDGGVFDEAVYGARQKIRAPGAIKCPQDPRVLAIPDLEDVPYYVIQHVPDDAIRLEVPPAQPQTRKRAAEGPPAAAPRHPSPPTPPDAAEADAQLPSGFSIPTDQAAALRLLADNGFLAPTFVGLPRRDSLTFRADNRGRCPCCGHDHERHNWFATTGADGVLLAKSYSDRCRLTAMRPVQQILDVAAGQEAISQRLALVERRQGQTELDVTVIRNTLHDFGPHIEAALNQQIAPNSLIMREDASGFGFSCAGDAQHYRCDILVNPTCRLSVSSANATPIIAGWAGNATIDQIINNPAGDTGYVDWFRLHERRQLGTEWCHDKHFYFSSGSGWTRVEDDHLVGQRILDLLQPRLAVLDQIACGNCLPPDIDAAERKRIKVGARGAFKHLQRSGALRTILEAARTVFHRPSFAERMDRDRHLLGTQDGAINLRTGELEAPSAFPMVSMSVRPHYRGTELPTPDVDAFFSMVFNGDREMVDYMQALLGAATTGERLEVYACFVGAGANGKGVTVGWLRHVLGPYYKEADAYIFFGDKRHGTGPTPALAELDRKRLAVVDESNPADELNLAIVKRVTGTDVISCRQLYRDPVEMPVTHTQILLTNNLPKFDVDDQALERRIVVIPFNLKFVKDADYDEKDTKQRRADPTLARFLEGENPSEQLLVWLVRGAMRFYAAGHKLPPKPPAVRDAERGYYAENDLLGQVVEETCDVGADCIVPAAEFNALARSKNVGRGIKGAMSRRGFSFGQRRIDGKKVEVYCGLCMKT